MTETAGKRRVGIYGGTFAPVHNGHVYVAHSLLEYLRLDRLLIVPDRKPPHKKIAASDDPQRRLDMLRLAFPEEADGRIAVSDYEIRADHPSYTALTLQHFSKPDVRLYFFCGTDMFETLDSWYHPEIIFRCAAIVHIRREAEPQEKLAAVRHRYEALARHYEEKYGAEILQPDIKPYPLSSTEVRRAAARGSDISHMVPGAVAAYIREHHLYEGEEASV